MLPTGRPHSPLPSAPSPANARLQLPETLEVALVSEDLTSASSKTAVRYPPHMHSPLDQLLTLCSRTQEDSVTALDAETSWTARLVPRFPCLPLLRSRPTSET